MKKAEAFITTPPKKLHQLTGNSCLPSHIGMSPIRLKVPFALKMTLSARRTTPDRYFAGDRLRPYIGAPRDPGRRIYIRSIKRLRANLPSRGQGKNLFGQVDIYVYVRRRKNRFTGVLPRSIVMVVLGRNTRLCRTSTDRY